LRKGELQMSDMLQLVVAQQKTNLLGVR